MSQLSSGRAHAMTCTPHPLQFLPVSIVLCALLMVLLPTQARAATYTFPAVADGYTRSDAVTTSYGGESRLSARDARRQMRNSYLRFNVALLPGETITRATLNVSTTSSGSSVELRDVANDTWTEAGLTWNSAPEYGPSPVSRLGSVSKSQTASFDATPLITGDGPASMAIKTPSSTTAAFRSREAGSGGPELVIQTSFGAPEPTADPAPAPAPAPDTTAPDTFIASTPASATTSTSASFGFAGTDNVTLATALTFQCSLDGAPFSPCASIKTYSGLAVGLHTFAVQAVDGAGNVDASPAQFDWQITAIEPPPPPADSTAPSAPSALTALASDGSVALSWVASSDNVAVTGYRVYRDDLLIASPAGTSYVDSAVTNGTSYSYTAKAFDGAGNLSGASNTATATPQAPAPPPPVSVVGDLLPARLAQSTGATFYVATSGSDSNPGTISSPWRTVQKALSTLTAGQTALVRAGTYSQNTTMTRAGTASAPITIRNYPGEKPVLSAGSGSTNNMPLQLGNGAAYVRLQGLTFHGATGPSTTNIYAWGNAHDIEISDCEVSNSQRQGFFSEKTNSKIHIIGCQFHNNGGSGPIQQDHNIYIQGSYNAVLGNLLTGAANGNGIQVYPSSDHITIASNTITGNFREGIIIGSDGNTTTTDSLITNNIITNSQTAITTYWGGTQGTRNIARNNLAHGNTQGNFTGNGITYQNNQTANPQFINAGAGDYHLQTTSPALNIADPQYTTPLDLDATTRPQGTGPDLGAYER